MSDDDILKEAETVLPNIGCIVTRLKGVLHVEWDSEAILQFARLIEAKVKAEEGRA